MLQQKGFVPDSSTVILINDHGDVMITFFYSHCLFAKEKNLGCNFTFTFLLVLKIIDRVNQVT